MASRRVALASTAAARGPRKRRPDIYGYTGRRATISRMRRIFCLFLVAAGLLTVAPGAAAAAVEPRSASFEGGGFEEFSQTNAANGSLAPANDRAYDGGVSAHAAYGGVGENGYARGIWDVQWQDGEDVWFGAAFYLPLGFHDRIQGQVDLMRWDNWSTHPADTDWGGVSIYGFDRRARLLRFGAGRQNDTLVGPFDLPEGRWFRLEVHQRLAGGGDALSELYVDGALVGSSTAPNTYGRGIDAIRFGVVAIAAGEQQDPLGLWFDRATVGAERSSMTIPEPIPVLTIPDPSESPDPVASEPAPPEAESQPVPEPPLPPPAEPPEAAAPPSEPPRPALRAPAPSAASYLSTASGPAPSWLPLTGAPPPERQEVSYVAVGGALYLAGGDNLDQDRYDPATGEWTAVADLPHAFDDVDHLQGVAVDGKIVYIGGLTSWPGPGQPFPVVDTVAVYDPATNTFEEGAEMPEPRAAGGVAAWKGKAIYAGGLGPDGSVAQVDAYDPAANTWTDLKPMPRARDHFQAAILGDELYAVGGRNTAANGDTQEIAAVDALDLPGDASGLATASWRQAVTMLPTPRGGHGVAAVGNCIYAIGGEGVFGGDEGVTGATEAYDVGNGQWYALEPLATPRHGIQAAVVGSRIFVAAGGEKPFGYEPTAAHEVLDVGMYAPCGATGQEGEDEDEGDGGSGGKTGQTPAGSPAGSPSASGPSSSGVPVLSRLAILPQRWRKGSRVQKARVVVDLSQQSKVVLRLQRAHRGYRVGQRCVRRRQRPKGSTPCTFWKQRWQDTRALPAGESVIGFSTRSGPWALPPGRYRLLGAIPDGAAPHPSAARAPFRVVE
jgi:hypothetical protein